MLTRGRTQEYYSVQDCDDQRQHSKRIQLCFLQTFYNFIRARIHLRQKGGSFKKGSRCNVLTHLYTFIVSYGLSPIRSIGLSAS